MNESRDRFPHIELKFSQQGVAAPNSVGSRAKSAKTQTNLGDRWGHGNSLKSSVSGIVSDWQEQLVERQQEQKPDLPKAVPLVLKVDPQDFDAEELRKFGIEVIAELEDGYIIGASAESDPNLTKLQQKIEKFINSEHGGTKVCEIWEIIDRLRRPEYVLSPELQTQWENIQDEQICTVDVGISCLGDESKLKNHPKIENYQNDAGYDKAINKWIDNRDLTYQQWDDTKSQREEDFIDFVNDYQGEFLSPIIDGETSIHSELPDSFSCRINISGKGLKDLVLNFPFVFDVSLPDEVCDDSSAETQQEDVEISFTLEQPKSNAPTVCIIDSGIQENHPLLKHAIVTNDSRSWVPNETDLTADRVANGGHGTRVAGAVLYPRSVPTSGQQQAACWLQNARVLDRECRLPQTLFPPTLIANIVNFYYPTGTRIFNHSIAGSTPCRTQYMSAWAAGIDNLTWQNDILLTSCTNT